MLYQQIFYKFNLNQLKTNRNLEEKDRKIYRIFAIRLKMTFLAIVPNFVFLSLTNLDLFLFLNIMLTLWMIYLFPYPEKIKHLVRKLS